MAMSAGEYVFSSQSDTEHADLASERRQLLDGPEFEEGELAQIYVARGVEAGLARQVAQQLRAKDALSARMPGMSLPFRSPIAPLGLSCPSTGGVRASSSRGQMRNTG